MKKLWVFCAVFPVLLWAADAVRSDGLIFHHTFESKDFSADFAAGEKRAKVNNAALTDGISGKGLLVGSDAKLHNIQFPTKNNFAKLEGSVSFWMKPLDYDGNTPGWVFLFDAAEPSNQGFRFYKYTGKFFWFTVGKINKAERKTDIQIALAKGHTVKKGEWHHVVITWRAGGQTYIGKESRQRIYINGKITQERTLDDKFIPLTIPALFTIGPSCRWNNTANSRTVIDEFKIYDRELLPDQVKAEYYRFFTPEVSANNTLNAAPAASAPAMDCQTPWANASQYNTFYNQRRQWSTDVDANYFLAYDKDFLYIRIVEKLHGRKRVMAKSGRDGELYWDDCWEIYVGSKRNDQYRHYIFNGSGDVYDGIGRVGNWNGSSRHKAIANGEVFALDIAIPAKDLGMDSFKAGDSLIFSLGKTVHNQGGSRVYYSNNLLGGHFHHFQKFSTLKLAVPGKASGAVITLDDTEMSIAGAFPDGGEAELICNGKESSKTALKAPAAKLTLRRSDIPLQYELKVKDKHGVDITIPFTCVPNVLINFEMEPKSGNMIALLYPASVEVEKQLAGAQVTLTFTDKNGKVTAAKKVPFAKKVVLAPAEQPTASGKLQAVFTVKGKEIMRTSAEYYHIDYAAWKDYNGGMDDNDVPTPWTPVEYKNGILKCWSRDHDFSKRALPEQLFQAGNPLLRGKAVLRAVIGGKRYDLSNVKLTPVYTSKGKYTLKGSGNIAGCQIEAELDFEFDGFTLARIKIDRKNVKIDALTLEFPLRKELSSMKFVPFLNEKGVQKDDIGFVKNDQSWQFTPGIWVGNDERGLTWFSESDEFFYLKNRNNAIRLSKNSRGEALLAINFIDHADPKMPKVLDYVFGFQVTPLKPFPEPQDWMNYAFVAAPNAKIFISGWHNRVGKNYQGFPGFDGCMFGEQQEKENLAWVRKLVSSDNPYKRPMMPVRYLYPNMCAITVPEFNAFRSYWAVSPSDVWGTDGPEVVPSVRVSPMAQSWANLFCYRFDKYFATTTEHGLYQDFCHPIKDTNPVYCAGYVRDGKRYPTYCLYKFREIQKRLYRIAKKYETPQRKIFFIGHTGGSYILPHANFFSLVNEGEYLGAVVNQAKPYLDFFDEGRWRAEWNGRQFGVLINFIPSRSKDLKFTNEIFSIIVPGAVTWMLHTEINNQPQQRVYRAYAQFGGYSGVEKFLPYWANSEFLSVSDSGIKATILVKGKKALLLTGNWNSNKTDAIFTFSNMEIVKVTDCDSRQTIPVQDNEFTAPVEGKNFKIFLLDLK